MTRTADLRVAVPLPAGTVEVSAVRHQADRPWAVLALTHGAGTRSDHPFLVGFAEAVAAAGVSCVRFDLPYAQAGRRVPGPAAHAVAAWAAVMAALEGSLPVFAAGRSYGGRMASMAAAEERIAAAGLVYLGYPLHPPGRPDRPRVDHLPQIAAPQLFVSGTRDPFVDPHEQLERAVASCRDAALTWIEGGGHGYEVARRCRPAVLTGAEIAGVVLPWLRAHAPEG